MLSRSLPAKLSVNYFHGFLSVQHAVSLPPSEAFRKLFARFPIRPACCLAPSQQSSQQAISTVSSPSSMLSRSLPAKLSASYLHGFLSVQHAVSLPPSEALRKLFHVFLSDPACPLAPSQRSFPQAICTVSSPPACCLAPSQRSFPQAISSLPPFLPSFLPPRRVQLNENQASKMLLGKAVLFQRILLVSQGLCVFLKGPSNGLLAGFDRNPGFSLGWFSFFGRCWRRC